MVLGRIIGAVAHGIKTVGRYVSPVAKFIGRYHHHIAPLAHGLAMASGNETAQKITGAALAVSNMASMRQKLNAGNERIASAMSANDGKAGVYNHATGQLR